MARNKKQLVEGYKAGDRQSFTLYQPKKLLEQRKQDYLLFKAQHKLENYYFNDYLLYLISLGEELNLLKERNSNKSISPKQKKKVNAIESKKIKLLRKQIEKQNPDVADIFKGFNLPSKNRKKKFYATLRWREARKEAFDKHGRICKKCHSVVATTIHHIIPIEQKHVNYPSLYSHILYGVDNLQPLCEECHQRIHNILPKKEKK